MVYTHSISGNAVNRGDVTSRAGPANAAETPGHNAAARAAGASGAAAQAAASTGPRSPAALFAAAGLPADKLSSSIISFARFFSLPIKPELMTEIRRQALAPSTANAHTAEPAGAAPAKTGSADTAAQNRETLALAAAAARDKGAELNPRGLESFSEAIDPDWDRRHSGGDRSGEDHARKQQHKERGKDNDDSDDAPAKTPPLSAAGLKEYAMGAAEDHPLLALLNKLPGKNGQHWIVLPFVIHEAGSEYRISLRVLIGGKNPADAYVQRMAVDIVENGETGRRWLFVPELAGAAISRLSLYLQPELPPQAAAALARALSAAMHIPLDCVDIKNTGESFPSESAGGDDLLRAVNEAV